MLPFLPSFSNAPYSCSKKTLRPADSLLQPSWIALIFVSAFQQTSASPLCSLCVCVRWMILSLGRKSYRSVFSSFHNFPSRSFVCISVMCFVLWGPRKKKLQNTQLSNASPHAEKGLRGVTWGSKVSFIEKSITYVPVGTKDKSPFSVEQSHTLALPICLYL